MSKYVVSLSKTATKQLDKLPDNIASPIIIAMQKLGDNPRPVGYKKLKALNNYRIRVGNYRVIYDVFDKILTVEVIELGHRKDIYK